jgi:hypothetical protein
MIELEPREFATFFGLHIARFAGPSIRREKEGDALVCRSTMHDVAEHQIPWRDD